MGLGTGYNTTALRVPEPNLETTQAGHKPWPSVWTSHQHTVGHAGTDRHAWNMPGPGGETPGPNSKVCVHMCMHTNTLACATHTQHTHTHAHKPNRHLEEQGENGTGDKASQPEQQDDTHTAMRTLRSREETHLGMPRCAGELGRTETEKAGSSLRDRHPENQTHDAPAVRTWPCLNKAETPPLCPGTHGRLSQGLGHSRARAHTHGHTCADTHTDTHARTRAYAGRHREEEETEIAGEVKSG